ncbi:hypothetical protein GCM10027091_47310 [Streptomyces daliensis]
MVDAAHDEVVAVALDQAAVADVKAGGLGTGRRCLRGGRAEGAESDEDEECGQEGQQGGDGSLTCRASRCSHWDSKE